MLFTLICCQAIFSQPGKYAGSKQMLIGKTYTDSHKIMGLGDYTPVEGSVLNDINDPELIIGDVFRKGTTYVIVFSIKEDTALENYQIADVVEIKGVAKGWTVRSACRQYKQPDSYIFVFGKETLAEYMKTIKKAWRFYPDKRRVEVIPVKGIDCENIGC